MYAQVEALIIVVFNGAVSAVFHSIQLSYIDRIIFATRNQSRESFLLIKSKYEIQNADFFDLSLTKNVKSHSSL